MDVWGEEEKRIRAAQICNMSHRVAGGTYPWPRRYAGGTDLGQEAKVQVELALTLTLVEIFSRQSMGSRRRSD